MLALHLTNQKLSIAEKPIPTPPPGEALIRVLKAGICNTDLELIRGYYPYTGILGHEFVGVVETPGEWYDKRVCGEINAVPPGCTCPQCLAGRKTHCDRRTVLGIVNRHGAFATYLTLPFENLHPVPASVPDDEAVFTEPLAAALEIPTQIQIHPTDTVVVIGDGKLGLLCAQVLALTGCHLLALGRHRKKLAILAARGLCTALVGAIVVAARNFLRESSYSGYFR